MIESIIPIRTVFLCFGEGGELAADTSGVGTESLGGGGSPVCVDDREDHKRKVFSGREVVK